MRLQGTTWQTVGPYFRIGLEPRYLSCIAPENSPGQHISIQGMLFDGKGKPVPDAILETWQANSNGVYCSQETAGFRGFGRIATDADGKFGFSTIMPGQAPGPAGTMQAPHLAVRIMMRGLLKDLVTRVYFPHPELNADPVLQLVPAERRTTIIAAQSPVGGSAYLWNIELQGERETVFFDC